MPQDKKTLELRQVDDEIANPPTVVRLRNAETKSPEIPVRLGPKLEKAGESRRLAIPSREEAELRTHQPDIESIIGAEADQAEHLEESWGESSSTRHPIPWGWFALIGLLICWALVWSLNHLDKSDDFAQQILIEAETLLVDEEQEQQEASLLIDSIDSSIRKYFTTTSVEGLSRLVRHPKRVLPLMREYYADKPVFIGRLASIKLLQPLTLGRQGNFWKATIALSGDQSRDLLIEITESGVPLVDWETFVCHQPMDWDEYATKRPAATTMDFRVYAQQDIFFSHEFANANLWTCYRLTTRNSEELLFGYVKKGSPEAEEVLKHMRLNSGRRTSLILRLTIPEGLLSRSGVVIDKVLSSRWVYLNEPGSST